MHDDVNVHYPTHFIKNNVLRGTRKHTCALRTLFLTKHIGWGPLSDGITHAFCTTNSIMHFFGYCFVSTFIEYILSILRYMWLTFFLNTWHIEQLGAFEERTLIVEKSIPAVLLLMSVERAHLTFYNKGSCYLVRGAIFMVTVKDRPQAEHGVVVSMISLMCFLDLYSLQVFTVDFNIFLFTMLCFYDTMLFGVFALSSHLKC